MWSGRVFSVSCASSVDAIKREPTEMVTERGPPGPRIVIVIGMPRHYDGIVPRLAGTRQGPWNARLSYTHTEDTETVSRVSNPLLYSAATQALVGAFYAFLMIDFLFVSSLYQITCCFLLVCCLFCSPSAYNLRTQDCVYISRRLFFFR